MNKITIKTPKGETLTFDKATVNKHGVLFVDVENRKNILITDNAKAFKSKVKEDTTSTDFRDMIGSTVTLAMLEAHETFTMSIE